MKTSQTKLEVKSKTHKNKKQTKQRLIRRNLCILGIFFLILITYFDRVIEKDKISLITYNNNNLYTNVTKKELLNILNKETGIVILINDKESINRIINLLYEIKTNESIYLYNLKNDEIILELTNNDEIIVKQDPTKFYYRLTNKLGSHIGNYILKGNRENIIKTNYQKIYTPIVLFIKNGKILLSHFIIDDVEDESLIEIYKQGLEMIKGYNS